MKKNLDVIHTRIMSIINQDNFKLSNSMTINKIGEKFNSNVTTFNMLDFIDASILGGFINSTYVVVMNPIIIAECNKNNLIDYIPNEFENKFNLCSIRGIEIFEDPKNTLITKYINKGEKFQESIMCTYIFNLDKEYTEGSKIKISGLLTREHHMILPEDWYQ